jgi:hypothetical protein
MATNEAHVDILKMPGAGPSHVLLEISAEDVGRAAEAHMGIRINTDEQATGYIWAEAVRPAIINVAATKVQGAR